MSAFLFDSFCDSAESFARCLGSGIKPWPLHLPLRNEERSLRSRDGPARLGRSTHIDRGGFLKRHDLPASCFSDDSGSQLTCWFGDIPLARRASRWYDEDMTPVLTEQIRQALDAERGQPVKIVDEQTSRIYYVITAEQFETVRALFAEGDFDPREIYPLISKTAGDAGWNDPSMEVYDNYDEHRK